MMKPSADISVSTELQAIGQAIATAGGRPVLVGGWVRDQLLGYPHTKDFDIEVFGLETSVLRRALKPFGAVHAVGRHFGVLKLTTREAEYDVSVPRREQKTGKGHKGFDVETDPDMTFDAAAARRDFTINAMGYAFLDGEFLDPFHGQTDLENSILRHVGPAFGEDPLRVMRAMQFAGRFNLTIVPETIAICQEQNLAELPKERMWEEFRKLLLKATQPSLGLRWMEPLGILPTYPELAQLVSHQAAWEATLLAIDRAAEGKSGEDFHDLAVLCAALTHRMDGEFGGTRAATTARTWMERITNETRLLDLTEALVRELPVVAAPLDSAGLDTTLRRLALRVPLPLVTILYHACMGPEHPSPTVGDEMERRAKELGVWENPPEPLLKGRHLQDLGVHPGRAMGDVLKATFERQLEGQITTLEEAIHWAREQLPH